MRDDRQILMMSESNWKRRTTDGHGSRGASLLYQLSCSLRVWLTPKALSGTWGHLNFIWDPFKSCVSLCWCLCHLIRVRMCNLATDVAHTSVAVLKQPHNERHGQADIWHSALSWIFIVLNVSSVVRLLNHFSWSPFEGEKLLQRPCWLLGDFKVKVNKGVNLPRIPQALTQFDNTENKTEVADEAI